MIQLAAAVTPSAWGDDSESLKKVSTALAAITAILIAADNKLNFQGKH